MKKMILVSAFALAIAACSAETPAENNNAAEQSQSNIINVNDETTGPVFNGPVGEEQIAVSGYDTVSYFLGDGVPVKGVAQHSVAYNGNVYHFANAQNAESFAKEPAKYAPQYGGHCAWALGANGALAPADPTKYRIVDGKLYLNFNQDVQDKWVKDIPGFINNADKTYPTLPSDVRFDD